MTSNMFIIWFLLASPFCLSTQDGNIRDSGKCGPQKLTLKTSKQVIQVTWEDDPSCLALSDGPTYELQVLRTGKLLENATLTVTPDQLGSAHSWNSSSLLALDCVSHSVRLRYRFKSHASPWNESQTWIAVTESGSSEVQLPEVYPKDGKFEVGSTVSFCCVVPEAQHFSRMFVEGPSVSNTNTTMVSRQIHAFTFQANSATSHSCTHIRCDTEKTNAACAYFGYSPDDRGLQCETRDLQSVECTWTAEKTHLNVPNILQKYHLLEASSKDEDMVSVECKDTVGTCKKKVEIDSGERTWKVVSENMLGKVELTDTADLNKRVRMFAPEELKIQAAPSGNVALNWTWEQQQYHNLNITCRVNISSRESIHRTLIEASGVGLHHAVLANVVPDVLHNATVQCGTAAHFWKWGDPSAPFLLEDVPGAPDIWMQTKGDRVYIFCKTPPANPSRAPIVEYEVIWNSTTGKQKGGKKNQSTCKPALVLNDTGEYTVTLRARNRQRNSTPSAVTVPSITADKPATYRAIGSNSIFNLSLPSNHQAVCGYILDWCPTQGQCEDEWLKVPPNQTHATVHFKTFDKGASKSLSVYACTKGAPVLLEKRELLDCSMSLFKPLRLKQRGSRVEISWDHLNLHEQETFIKGYTVYYANSQKPLHRIEDPMATIMTVKNLEISTYSFTVVAQTPLGRCGKSSGSISLTGEDIPNNFWLLVIPVMFFTLMVILCCRYWTCINEKMCPLIPAPVLTDRWPTKADCVAQHPEDEDMVDVSVLLSQQDFPSPFAANLGQPTKKNLFPLFTICPARAQSQAGLPFRGLLYNPSYLPISGLMDQHSHSCPDLKDGTPLERSAEGYQPQSQQNIFCLNQISKEPEGLLTCSSYISLPQSDAR